MQRRGLTYVYSVLVNASTRALLLYRVSRWFHVHRMKPLSSLARTLNIALHGCDISADAVIGANFHMAHTVGIVIGEAVLGDSVMLYQNVTIGRLYQTDAGGRTLPNRGFPVIEDDVRIFAGAVVLGEIVLGRGAQVGANAVVLDDVGEFQTAVGNRARVL